MKLTKPMLKAFKCISEGENTISRLAKATGKSIYWTDLVISALEKEDFVIKKKDYTLRGNRLTIEIAGTSHASRLRELLFEYQGITFDNLLTDGRLLFLTALSEDWMTKKVAMQLSRVSKYSIDRYMPSLKNRGVLMNDKTRFSINVKAWPLLREFLLAYKNYSKVNGQVKWKYQEETLYKITNENLVQDNTTTGLYEYKKYGVYVGVISALCVQPKRKISKEEVFVHSLFEVDDPRTLHLALTFYLKNSLTYNKVSPIAMKYGKYTMFENIIKILKSKEEKVRIEGMPTFERKDFMRIANMYGVEDV